VTAGHGDPEARGHDVACPTRRANRRPDLRKGSPGDFTGGRRRRRRFTPLLLILRGHRRPSPEAAWPARHFTARQCTLHDVVRDSCSRRPASRDVVVQDEYTHDVVLRGTETSVVYNTVTGRGDGGRRLGPPTERRRASPSERDAAGRPADLDGRWAGHCGHAHAARSGRPPRAEQSAFYRLVAFRSAPNVDSPGPWEEANVYLVHSNCRFDSVTNEALKLLRQWGDRRQATRRLARRRCACAEEVSSARPARRSSSRRTPTAWSDLESSWPTWRKPHTTTGDEASARRGQRDRPVVGYNIVELFEK
jgi:hypothetical protein